MHKKSFALISINSSGTMGATKADTDNISNSICREKEKGRDLSN